MKRIDPDDLRRTLVEFKKAVVYQGAGEYVEIKKGVFEEFCRDLENLIVAGKRDG